MKKEVEKRDLFAEMIYRHITLPTELFRVKILRKKLQEAQKTLDDIKTYNL